MQWLKQKQAQISDLLDSVDEKAAKVDLQSLARDVPGGALLEAGRKSLEQSVRVVRDADLVGGLQELTGDSESAAPASRAAMLRERIEELQQRQEELADARARLQQRFEELEEPSEEPADAPRSPNSGPRARVERLRGEHELAEARLAALRDQAGPIALDADEPSGRDQSELALEAESRRRAAALAVLEAEKAEALAELRRRCEGVSLELRAALHESELALEAEALRRGQEREARRRRESLPPPSAAPTGPARRERAERAELVEELSELRRLGASARLARSEPLRRRREELQASARQLGEERARLEARLRSHRQHAAADLERAVPLAPGWGDSGSMKLSTLLVRFACLRRALGAYLLGCYGLLLLLMLRLA